MRSAAARKAARLPFPPVRSEAAIVQSVNASAVSPRRPTPVRPPLRVAAILLGAAAFVAALTTLLYACSVHAVPGNSDGATAILEGRSIANGHFLLHGWSLSLDSFWLLDALVSAPFVAALGIRGELLNLVPAFIAALTVVAAMRVSSVGYRRAGALAGAVVAFAILGLPSSFLSALYLQGPLHVATALWCLVAFLLLRRLRVDGWFVLGVVLLATATVSDLSALFFGIIPLAGAAVTLMIRQRTWRAGVVPLAAALASGVLAWVIREVAILIGTFYINNPQQQINVAQMRANIHPLFAFTANMLGLGGSSQVLGGNASALEDVHVITAALVVLGALLALLRCLTGLVRADLTARPRATRSALGALLRPEEGAGLPLRSAAFLDDVVLFAFLADLVVFVGLTQAPPLWPFARYLSAAVIFGAVLGGRLAARLVMGIRRRPIGVGLAALSCAVLALLGVSVANNLGVTPPPQYAKGLTSFLLAHHLTRGLGDYWSSSITTVESHGRVTIRPVIAGPGNRLVPYPRNSQPAWFRASYQFFVFEPPTPFGGANESAAVNTFGPPAQTYSIPGYIILVWSAPHALPPSPGA
jgi:hypothetical protein